MGLESIDHAPIALTNRIIDDANRAHAKISTFLDNTYHFEDVRGVYVQPAVTTTVDAMRGSHSIANLSGSATWMNGCTCQVGDSTTPNRLRENLSSGNFELAMPFMGSTGTGIQIQIWHDSVQLPCDVIRIKGPFKYDANWIYPCEARDIRRNFGDTSLPGNPTRFAEITVRGGDAAQFHALLLDQIPAGDSMISYTAVGKIANFVDLNDTRVHTVPFDLEASVLFPIFSYYLAGYPLFEGDKGELNSDYEEAGLCLQKIGKRSAEPHHLVRPKR
jgi:hypothetical protein